LSKLFCANILRHLDHPQNIFLDQLKLNLSEPKVKHLLNTKKAAGHKKDLPPLRFPEKRALTAVRNELHALSFQIVLLRHEGRSQG
jgi:hypothetical protein